MADFTPKDWQTGDLITETDMDRIEQGIAQAFQLIADLPDAPTTAVPSGPAGGALDGNYPNPGLSTYHVDQITGGRVNDSSSATGVAVRNVAQAAVAAIVDAAPENLNTLKEISDRLANDSNVVAALTDLIGTKATPAQITQAINALPIPLTLSAFTAAVQGTPGFGGSGSNTYIGAARSQLTAPAFGSSVSNRGANRSVATSFGSSNLIETTRVRHVLTEDVGSIHLVYMGWYGGETDQVDATIKATIETATGSLHKLTFRGGRTHLLTNGSSVTTDPLGLVLKKGDLVWVRTTRTIASGTYYANTILRGLSGEGKVLTDSADTGTIAAAADDNSVGGFTAAALVSAAPSLGNSAIFIGDSVSNGKGEGYFDNSVPPVFIPVEERGGYMARATPDNVGIFRLNAGGGNALTFIANTVNAGGSRRRLPFATSGRYAWVEYGINDINSATDAQTVKDTLTKLWTTLAGMGLQVFQSTLTLWSGGSTDGYTTLENQTLWAKHAIRVEINDWIRTKPAPLTGYFEMADQIESSRNSGKWRVDLGALTTDGIHPNTLGHQTIAAAIAPAVSAAFTYTPVATTPGTSGPVSWGNISDKPTTFAPSAHSHPVSDISGFTAAVQSVPGFGGSTAQLYDIRNYVQSGETLVTDGSGVGNNTAIIQRAINALNTLYTADSKPRQIFFPDGTYLTSEGGSSNGSYYDIRWKSGVGIATSSFRGVRFCPSARASMFFAAEAFGNIRDVFCDPHVVDGYRQTNATYTSKFKGWFIQGLAHSYFNEVCIVNTFSTGFGCDYLTEGTVVTGEARNCGRGLKELAVNPLSTSGGSGFGIGTGRYEVEDFLLDVRAYDCGFHGVFTETQETAEPFDWSKGSRIRAYCEGNYVGFRDCGSDGLQADIVSRKSTYAEVLHDKTILTTVAGKNGRVKVDLADGLGVGIMLGGGTSSNYRYEGQIRGMALQGVAMKSGGAVPDRLTLELDISGCGGNAIELNKASNDLTLKVKAWNNSGLGLSMTGAGTATRLNIIDSDFLGGGTSISQTLTDALISASTRGYGTAPAALTNTVAPAITGTATTGQTLTVSNGTWSATPDSYTYQWKRAGVAISGATASSYVLQVADEGQAITATVTAIKTGYTSGSATSASVTPTSGATPALTNSVAPAVAPTTATTGTVLTTTNGTWSATPDSYTYQWRANGNAISGATASSYTVLVGDLGKAITCAVTAVKAGYTNGTAVSNSVTPPAGSSTAFVSDTFTGNAVALESHTGEVGATWTKNTQSGGAIYLNNDRIRSNNGALAEYVASGTPPTADYSVEADVYVYSLLTSSTVGVVARSLTADLTYYSFRYSVPAGTWAITKSITGTPSAITNGSFSATLVVGQTYRAKLTVSGSTLTGYVDGVQVVQVVDASITAAGKAGVLTSGSTAASATTGLHLDNYEAKPL